MQTVGISGSPSERSRSAWLLQLAQARLEPQASRIETIAVRDLPSQALLAADATTAPIRVHATGAQRAAHASSGFVPDDALVDRALQPLHRWDSPRSTAVRAAGRGAAVRCSA